MAMPKQNEPLLPVKAKSLLDVRERTLHARLSQAVPGHLIMVKVALSQLLAVERTPTRRHSQYDANRFKQFVADFVVCTTDFAVLAVIELDRRAQPRAAQRMRLDWRNELLQSSGIKVVRIALADIPGDADLRLLVAPAAAKAAPVEPARPRPQRPKMKAVVRLQSPTRPSLPSLRPAYRLKADSRHS